MPITISYDLRTDNNNHRNYVRSMFERFSWTRLGGSVLRYNWQDENGQEDWLNDVIPSLMIFRSYCIAHNINIVYFTLDTSSVTRIDASDPDAVVGAIPLNGDEVLLVTPTNNQSSEERIRRSITSMIDIFVTAPPQSN